MKILIANDGYHAHYYERLAWYNALNSIPGIKCHIFDIFQSKAFDVFDTFEPDIFIGQLYNLTPSIYKCIQIRPHLKTALRSGEWNNNISDPHILRVTEEEIAMLLGLKRSCDKPDLIYTHYTQQDIEITHVNFIEEGISLLGLPMSADVNVYCSGKYEPLLACDLGFVGGYWPYKSQVLDKYLLPLCDPKYNYKIKIFGNQPWPCNQYCGTITDKTVSSLFKSATICPNLSEPHAQKLGVDVNERAFKILAAGGFCIMDDVKAAKELLPEGIVFANSPEHFHELVDFYLDPKNKEQREDIAMTGKKLVLSQHTSYHRMASLLKSLGEDEYADRIEEVAKSVI